MMENKTMVQAALEVVKAVDVKWFLLHQPTGLVRSALVEAVLCGTMDANEAYEVAEFLGAEKARHELSNALRKADEERRLNG